MTRNQLIFVNKLTIQLFHSRKLKADKVRLSNRFSVDEGIVTKTVNELVMAKYLTHSKGYIKLTKEVKKELGLIKDSGLSLDGFTPPTIEEVAEYLRSKKTVSKVISKEMAKYFIDYYEEREWTYGKYDKKVKNWKLLFNRALTWGTLKDMLEQDSSEDGGLFTQFD